LAYLSDHEPALGARVFPEPPQWTSGFALAHGADILIHDAQYADYEYASHVGWGHSSLGQAITFASLTEARHLVAFHHDPWHDDFVLDKLYGDLEEPADLRVTAAREGMTLNLVHP